GGSSDQLRCEPEDRTEAEREDDRGQDEDREAVGSPDPAEDRESDGRRQQPGRDDPRGADAVDNPRREVRANDEPDRGWHGPYARDERRQAEDELEVLGDEQEVADGHEDRQEV